jgi:hypothetical protein
VPDSSDHTGPAEDLAGGRIGALPGVNDVGREVKPAARLKPPENRRDHISQVHPCTREAAAN